MSKLNHGSVFYGDTQRSLTDRLKKIQNKALRVCSLASHYTSTRMLHTQMDKSLNKPIKKGFLIHRSLKIDSPIENPPFSANACYHGSRQEYSFVNGIFEFYIPNLSKYEQ